MFPSLTSVSQLTPSQRREAIASLHGYPPYRYLLEDLAEVVESCLAALGKAKTEAEVLRAGRVYQVAFSFYTALTEHPQNLREQIDLEMAHQPEDPFQLTALDPARMQRLEQLDASRVPSIRKKT